MIQKLYWTHPDSKPYNTGKSREKKAFEKQRIFN